MSDLPKMRHTVSSNNLISNITGEKIVKVKRQFTLQTNYAILQDLSCFSITFPYAFVLEQLRVCLFKKPSGFSAQHLGFDEAVVVFCLFVVVFST